MLVISKMPAYQEWAALRAGETKPLPMFFPMIAACTGRPEGCGQVSIEGSESTESPDSKAEIG